MKNKLFALLLAGAMIFAFAGCGSTQEEAAEEAPAATTEEVTEAPTEAPAEDTPTTDAAAEDTAKEDAQADIGVDKATEIALADAGLKAADVEFTKQNSDIDDGVSIYEIEFISGETQYEYDIDAATGKILDKDTDSIYDD